MTGRPRKPDPAFLYMAIVAASGGALAIVFAIGVPIWAHLAGRPATPAFALFAAWGVAAFAGAYACFATYRISDDPRTPPRGGRRLSLVEAGAASTERDDGTARRAA